MKKEKNPRYSREDESDYKSGSKLWQSFVTSKRAIKSDEDRHALETLSIFTLKLTRSLGFTLEDILTDLVILSTELTADDDYDENKKAFLRATKKELDSLLDNFDESVDNYMVVKHIKE